MADAAVRKALYPGTFDILTNGHVDIIRRSAKLYDELVVAVAKNEKKTPLFSIQQRRDVLEETTKHWANVSVGDYEGLTVDYARKIGANVLIRGLRFITDFEYELQISMINRSMAPEIETLFLCPSQQYAGLSSSIIHEIASRGGDIEDYVPPPMAQCLKEMFGDKTP